MLKPSVFLCVLTVLQMLTAVVSHADDSDCKHREYCLGEIIGDDDITLWAISVFRDGKGLPDEQGDSRTGQKIYETQCGYCHGQKGVGLRPNPNAGPYPSLVGNTPPLTSQSQPPAQTVGSYWPYATTLYDYINRAMPFTQPHTLTHSEVYSVVAYVLELNGLFETNAVMDKSSLLKVVMPNAKGFICDKRPDTFNPRCMKDCPTPGDKRFDAVHSKVNVKPVPATDCMLGLNP